MTFAELIRGENSFSDRQSRTELVSTKGIEFTAGSTEQRISTAASTGSLLDSDNSIERRDDGLMRSHAIVVHALTSWSRCRHTREGAKRSRTESDRR